jgi:hypothetical protein
LGSRLDDIQEGTDYLQRSFKNSNVEVLEEHHWKVEFEEDNLEDFMMTEKTIKEEMLFDSQIKSG